MALTEQALRRFLPLLPDPAGWMQPLTSACARFSISTPERQAAFLAQVAHESGGFIRLEENLKVLGSAPEGRVPEEISDSGGREIVRVPAGKNREPRLLEQAWQRSGGERRRISISRTRTDSVDGAQQLSIGRHRARCSAGNLARPAAPERARRPRGRAVLAVARAQRVGRPQRRRQRRRGFRHHFDQDQRGREGLDRRKELWQRARAALR